MPRAAAIGPSLGLPWMLLVEIDGAVSRPWLLEAGVPRGAMPNGGAIDHCDWHVVWLENDKKA